MSSTHTVAQGEYLSGIAKHYGFANHVTIWNHPQNAALKKLRVNPNVLLPGDQAFIPDKAPKQESAPTGRTSRFRLGGR
jgi:N-acetylmuramoyl-L-alanine amidase